MVFNKPENADLAIELGDNDCAHGHGETDIVSAEEHDDIEKPDSHEAVISRDTLNILAGKRNVRCLGQRLCLRSDNSCGSGGTAVNENYCRRRLRWLGVGLHIVIGLRFPLFCPYEQHKIGSCRGGAINDIRENRL